MFQDQENKSNLTMKAEGGNVNKCGVNKEVKVTKESQTGGKEEQKKNAKEEKAKEDEASGKVKS